ncbi:hypothetical protein J4X46_05725, partial [Escherichia coli]
NGGKNSLNRLIRCVCGKKIGPDPRNFNQRVSLGRNDLLIRTFPSKRRNYQAFTTTPNARFWHKADAHSHANALPLTCQQPYRLLRNYGFLLESSPLNKL